MMHGPQRPVHTPYLNSPLMWKKDQRNNSKPRRVSATSSSTASRQQQQPIQQFYVPTSSFSYSIPQSNSNLTPTTSAPPPHISSLQKQSEPASPSTIATTISSHHSTPSPSPARVAIMSDTSNPADYTLFDETFLPDMQSTKNPTASHNGYTSASGPSSSFPLIIPQDSFPSYSQDMYGGYSNVASQQQQQSEQHQGGSMLRNQYHQGGYPNTSYDQNIKVESEDDVPGLSPNPKRTRFSSSARQSVSSVDTYKSPATPVQAPDTSDAANQSAARETTLHSIDKWLDEYLQNPTDLHTALPKLGRTYSDAVQDELYNPELITNNYPTATAATTTTSAPASNIAQYPQLYQQQQQHHHHHQQQQGSGSTSPYSATSSHFVPLDAYGNSMSQQQYGGKAQSAPKTTISPREALLDYSEPEGDVSNINLFGPMPSQSSRTSSRAGSDVEELRSQSSRRESVATSSSSHADGFRFGSMSHQLEGAYGSSGQYLNSYSHQPAPRHYSLDSGIERPLNTRADTGAYTCTYSGCGQRFTTSGKLQKHRREAHRKSTPTANSVSTAAAIASRNAQPGPHRCMRPNPSTGKPCNTVFSRPYDLTRHEDTIHNSRKQKVRCEICTDEKTFSRPDALVRHRRVKHGIH
jgi:hypothetical protein